MVDALPSGGSVRKDVLVRVQSWALTWTNRNGFGLSIFILAEANTQARSGLGLPLFQQGEASVSYTHLDVYKRQILRRSVMHF